MNGVMFVNRGISLGKKEERRVARLLKNRELDLTVRLNLGSGSAQVWTSDLSYDYVRINAAYRT
jgi:glutamate N-acetyltransferase/amino-acid N-acetyltransferase